MRSFIAAASAVLACAWCAAGVPASKLDSALEYLLLKQRAGQLEAAAPQAAAQGEAPLLYIRFHDVPSAGQMEQARAAGAAFLEQKDRPLGRGRAVMPVRIPWGRVEAVARLPFVKYVGTGWRPGLLPALDLSNPEVEAAGGAWLETDDGNVALMGKGTVIADMDTGVDVYHPALFRPDGGEFGWIDDNGNGSFDPGVDRVDLTGIGKGTPVLRFVEAAVAGWLSGGPVNPGGYQAGWDWLYADLNGDSARNLGPGDGFGESDPAYGEPVFLVNDAGEDGALNPGETLSMLATSKVLATYNSGDVTRRRGTDLHLTAADSSAAGHGTTVAGIMAGEWPGHALTGLAPEADLLVADIYNTSALASLLWAEAEGADVVLHEFGSFVWEYLDGSGDYEQEMDALSAKGIFQITPSGNLAGTNKHCRFMSSAGGVDSKAANAAASATAFYVSYLWENEATEMQLGVTVPGGASDPALPLNPSFSETTVGIYDIWSRLNVSDRGTVRLDLAVERSDMKTGLGGTFTFTLTRTGGSDLFVYGYVLDNASSWSGGSRFSNFTGNFRCVSAPATADTAIVCGSYATRAHVNGTAGDISDFSGRGPRMGGDSVISVAAPGHFDVYAPRSKDVSGSSWGTHRRFAGTSAAVPHLAAGAALMKQYLPSISWEDARGAFRAGAFKDGFTGGAYNDTWGDGKLRIRQALIEADRTPPDWDGPAGLQSASGDACLPAVDLAWGAATDALKNPVSYNIYRSTSPGFTPGPATFLASTASTSYSDVSVSNGITYYYIVRAEDAAIEPNEDANLVELSAAGGELPAPPVGNTLMAGRDLADVDLSWADAGAEDYAVYGGTNPAALSLLDTTAGFAYTHTPPDVPVYFYSVRSRNSCGDETP